MTKRILALLLALVMLCSVMAGCSKKENSSGNKIPGSNTDSPVVVKPQSNEEKAASTTKYAYQAEYFDLPEEINWLNGLCGLGNKLYYVASVEDGEITESYTYTDDNGEEHTEEYTYSDYRDVLFTTDLTTGETKKVEAYTLPAGEREEDRANIRNIKAGPDGTIWVLAVISSSVTNLPENFDPETDNEWNYTVYSSTSILQHITAEGETIDQFEIELPKPEDQDWANEMSEFIVGKDMIYGSDWQYIYLIDMKGNVVATLDMSEYGGNLVQLSGDQIGIASYDYDEATKVGGYYFIPIDPATKTLSTEKVKLNADAWSVFPGDDVYDFYYEYNGNIFGYKVAEEKKEKVVDWMECDIDSNDMNGYFMLDGGSVAAVLSHYSQKEERNSLEIVVLTRVEASQVQNKTILTLACMGVDWDLRSRIVEYNKQSKDTRIVVKDYSEYSTNDDAYAGLTKLNTEIISGVIPDMFWTMGLPMSKYEAKGLVADLYPLIDADADFTRDSFVPQILKAAEVDGKLYELPQSFYISTAFGLKRVVDAYDTWTLEDLADAMSKIREDATVFDRYYTRDSILYECVTRNIRNYVDWQNADAHFDSESFIKLLEFANSFPEVYNWEEEDNDIAYESNTARMKSGKQLLSTTTISSFEDYIWNFYGGEFSFIGYPMEDGSYGGAFSADGSIAISTACQTPELAWDFIASMMTEEAQSEVWSFPVNKAAFDAKIEDVMTEEYYTDENGKPMDWDGDGEPDKMPKGNYQIAEPNWDDPNFNYADCYVEVYALTQDEVNVILDVIDRTPSIMTYDLEVMNIIVEEAAAYFAGDKTAQEVANLIQGRVKLYIMEQS
ncbi:MAG: hypothetical protein MJ118_05320 [Clostridia bacterium]|nr:hypothetical protein [Clostridia bacterium]